MSVETIAGKTITLRQRLETKEHPEVARAQARVGAFSTRLPSTLHQPGFQQLTFRDWNRATTAFQPASR